MSAYPITKKRLGEILIEAGSITEEQLQQALERQKTARKRLGRILVDMNILSEVDIIEALSKQLSIPIFDVEDLKEFDQGALDLVPRDVAIRDIVLPIAFKEKEISILISDPLDLEAIQDVEFAASRVVKLALSPESKLLEAIERAYETSGTAEKVMGNFIPGESIEIVPEASGEELDESKLVESTDAPPIVRLVSLLISDGVTSRASDIHLEAKEKFTVVRYRIDGEMRKIMTIPSHLHQSVISRIKVMSNMDISERRKPLDGSTKVKVGGRVVDLRISTLPSLYGERLVMRILDPERALVPLEKLGLDATSNRLFQNLIKYPQGILLITGPTGSGKTTLLYSAMDTLRTEETTLITLEDPIEYRLEGINQVQVNEKVGMTFAAGLRSILRQDPDIVMVGEIRDQETGEIAFRAAQTGHLVLATLHTNDAVATVTRLYDIGLPPYLVASSLLGIVAQRLIRKVCDFCRRSDQPDLSGIQAANLPKVENYYKGDGCQKCNFTGYLGRVGVYEVVPFDADLRQMVAGNIDEAQLSEALRAKGIRRMFDAAWEKLQMGITTMDEIMGKVPWPPEIGLGVSEASVTEPEEREETEPVHPHILVIDCDTDEGSELVSILRTGNYQCTMAQCGEEGLRLVHQHPTDLVILAPGSNGDTEINMVGEMRKKLETSRIPVIIVADPEDLDGRMKALKLGADQVLSRPVEQKVLLEKVETILSGAHAEA